MKKRLLSLLLVLVLLLTMLPTVFATEAAAEAISAGASGNLIANGGFETLVGDRPDGFVAYYSIPDPWETRDGWGTKGFVVNGEENVASGNNAVRLVDTEGLWTRLGFEVSGLKANTDYVLSFKAKGTSGQGLGVVLNGSVVAQTLSDNNPDANEWKTMYYLVNPGDATTIGFLIDNGWANLDVILDDLSLQELGENCFANGSFEEVNSSGVPNGVNPGGFGAPVGWNVSLFVNDDPENACDGSRSIKLVNADAAGALNAAMSVGFEAGRDYLFTFKVKGTAVTTAGDPYYMGADIHQYSSSGYVGTVGMGTDTVNPKADQWTTAYHIFSPGENVTSAVFEIGVAWGISEVYIDDVALYPIGVVEEAPVYGPIGENLLSNGDFETLADGRPVGFVTYYSIPDPWATYDGWGTKGLLVTGEENVASGSNAVRLVDTEGLWTRLGFEVSGLKENTDYVLSFKAKGTSGQGLGVVLNGSVVAQTVTDNAPDANEWKTMTYTFNTGASTTMGFLVDNGWATLDVILDDMSLYEYGEVVEEPEEPEYGPIGDNLVANGDFETVTDGKAVGFSALYSIPDPWATLDGWGTKGLIVSGEENVASGSYAVRLVDTENRWTRLGFEVYGLKANTTYILSFKAKGTSGQTLGVVMNGSVVAQAITDNAPSADEWKTMTYLCENGEATMMGFLIDNGWENLDVIIDDITLHEYGVLGTEPDTPDEPADPEDSVISYGGPNLIVNGSFEEVDENGAPTGMSLGGDAASSCFGQNITICTDPEYVAHGNQSLCISQTEKVWTYANLHADVQPNTTYVLVIKAKGDGHLQVGADLEYFAADHHIKHEGTGDSTKYVNPNTWTTMTHVLTTPGDCVYMEFAVCIPWNTGTIYFDEIGLYAAGDNLAENGDFEQVEDGKSVGHGYSGYTSLDSEYVYEGSYSLKLSKSDSGHAFVQVPARGLDQGATYKVSFRMMGALTGPMGVDVELYTDDNGHNKAEYYYGLTGIGATFMPTAGWTECVGYFTLPVGCTAVNLTIGYAGNNTGTIYLDNVTMQKVENAVLGELLPERIFYYPEETETFAEFRFNPSYNAAENYTMDMYLLDGETVLAQQTNIPIVDDTAVFEFNAQLMTQKKYAYTVKAVAKNPDGTASYTATETVYVYDRPLDLNENGEYVEADGSIFYPVQAFWGPDQWSELEQLAEAGVNVILWSMPSDPEERIKQLDELHALGMKASVVCFWGMLPAGHPLNVEQVSAAVEQIKDHPAIYAWNIADEPYGTCQPYEGMSVREMMINSYKMIRDIDDQHPVTYVEADKNRYSQADDYSDIPIIDVYPGTSGYENIVGDYTENMVSSIGGSRHVNVLIQGFTWFGHLPTEMELQTQLDQAFLAGAQSVGYFGIGGAGDGVGLENREDLWAFVQSWYDSGEYEILYNQYSSGVEPFVASVREDANVWYDIWEADGVYYALVQNRTNANNTVTVPLDLNMESAELVNNFFTAGLAIVDGGFTAELAPAQSALIKLTPASDEPETGLKIVTQPASYEGLVGDTVEFTVVAEGEGLTYEWFYKAVGSDQWLKSYSTGADTATLSVELRAYRDGQQYMCVVTDANGETVESDAAAMTLKAGEFFITEQPVDFEGAENAMATFTVVAEGDNLSYRWKYSNDGGETWKDSWSDGYATDTLTVELKAYRNGQQYKCVVTNAKGEAIESDAASMSLKESAIEITAQPENATVAAGETVTFTVEAEGENLKYRWYRSSDRETWTETWLTGYNTNELSFVVNASRAGYAYKCVITSGTNTVETDAVSVVIK